MDRFQVNRESILNCVQHQLREDLMRFGVARPLGELIPAIAMLLRTQTAMELVGVPRIVPMPVVAAFVDGTATLDEERMVCEAVMVDNSVLAEIAAALRAKSEMDSIPELEQSFTERLLSLPQFASLPQLAEPNSMPVSSLPVSSLPVNSLPVSSLPVNSLPESEEPLQELQKAMDDLETRSFAIRNTASNHRHLSANRWYVALGAIATLAASIVAVVWLNGLELSSPTRTDPNTGTLGANGANSNRTEIQKEIQNQIDPLGLEQRPDTNIAESPIGSDFKEPENEIANNVPEKIAIAPSMEKDKPRDEVPDKNPIEALQSTESSHAPQRIAGIRWTKISGLLAHRIEKPMAPDPAWGGVEIGSRNWESADDLDSLELKTLPLSRAEASLASGGKLVLAADTGARWRRATQREPDRMELQHGQLAMIDLPQGTLLELQREGKMIGTLRWDTKASVVLGVTASGLQAMIQGGEVSVNDASKKNTTITIEPGNVSELKERSGRMPSWVSKPTESVALPKAILAQIAESNNLGNTLTQLIESEQLDEPRSTLLSAWRASLASESLIRQAGVRRPVLRIAAIQRIVNTPEWDRRYAGMWAEVAAAMGDDRKVQLLKSMAQLVRQKGKPNATQVYALVAFLEAPDIASRSLGDFLLRQFYSGGPGFDPTWTGETNARGVGLWRRFIAQSASANQNR